MFAPPRKITGFSSLTNSLLVERIIVPTPSPRVMPLRLASKGLHGFSLIALKD